MTFILEVWEDESLDDPTRTYEFDTFEEAQKFAQELITKEEKEDKDFAYFIVDSDESDTWYDIW